MNSRQGLLMAHISVILFGMSGVLAKWIPQSSTVLTGGRSLIGALGIGLFLLITRKFILPDRRTLLILFGSGLLLALHWIAFYQSVKVSTVNIGVIAVTTFPVMTAVLEPFVMKEKWRWEYLISPLCIIAGTLVLLGTAPKSSDMLGLAYGFLAAAIYVIIHFINKLRIRNMTGMMVSFIQLAVAGIVLSPFVITGYDPSLDTKGLDIPAIIFLGIFCTAAAYSLFIESMRAIPARTTAVLSGLEPVYASMVAYFWLKEDIALHQLIGGSIIVASVIWSSMRVE